MICFFNYLSYSSGMGDKWRSLTSLQILKAINMKEDEAYM